MRWYPAPWGPGSGPPGSPPHRHRPKPGCPKAPGHTGGDRVDAAQLFEMSTRIPPNQCALGQIGHCPRKSAQAYLAHLTWQVEKSSLIMEPCANSRVLNECRRGTCANPGTGIGVER